MSEHTMPRAKKHLPILQHILMQARKVGHLPETGFSREPKSISERDHSKFICQIPDTGDLMRYLKNNNCVEVTEVQPIFIQFSSTDMQP